MRPEFDNEIDSVLRGHARRGGALPGAWDAGLRPSISNEGASTSHLDADEIAAFGEGALPAAARARYSAHLADCDDCRRSVAQVALAAGVADRIEQSEPVKVAAAAGLSPSAAAPQSVAARQSPSWRERLSAVFAPRAWRYAMPAVALLAVGVIAVVVMRGPLREGQPEDAAAGSSSKARPAATPAAPELHHANTTQQPPPADQTAGASTLDAAPVDRQVEDADAGSEGAMIRPKGVEDGGRPVVGGAASSGAPQPVAQTQAEPSSAPQSYPETVTVSTPTPLPPPAAAAPRALVLRDVAPQATPAPAHEHAEITASERSRGETRQAATRDEAPATKRHGPQRGGARVGELSSAADAPKDDRALRRGRGPQNNQSNNAAGANRNEPDESKAKREADREQQAETRSVGGRRFRREGGVWIDTAYKPAQATVVVRRDSEQYRALVADVPEIGRISRALGGEAVIVWKGRAYRVKP